MKKKLLLLIILIVLFLIFILIKFFFLNQKAGFGKLKGLSSPEASIFLDNVAIGKTPYEDNLKEGEYVLKFIPEGNATEAASWQGKIQIHKNALTYVDRELGSSDLTSAGVIFTTIPMKDRSHGADFGEVEVTTEPAGAIVYLDNDEKGIAPLLLTDVLKGEHELSVYSPSFFRKSQKINIDAGYRVLADFKLALDPSQKKVDLSGKTEEKKTASPTAALKNQFVQILDTPTGFLRVREEPTINASEEAQVKPNDKFPLLDEQPNWYQIEYIKDKKGWISAQYAKKVDE
jgi:hypothetical protein